MIDGASPVLSLARTRGTMPGIAPYELMVSHTVHPTMPRDIHDIYSTCSLSGRCRYARSITRRPRRDADDQTSMSPGQPSPPHEMRGSRAHTPHFEPASHAPAIPSQVIHQPVPRHPYLYTTCSLPQRRPPIQGMIHRNQHGMSSVRPHTQVGVPKAQFSKPASHARPTR